VRITIGKRIPVMGGLAGGSTNAATTILLLNELWGLSLSREELVTLGREIGMDVPFYFVGNTAFDSEAGLRLEPIATTSSFDFVLACPEFGVSTREAYAGIDYSVIGSKAGLTESMRAAFLAGNCAGVVSCMHNDFEYSVFQRNPRLALIKQELQDAGCLGAMMTGSGSTVIGIAQNAVHAESVRKRISCRTIISKTKKPEAI
jgi:4-diphosphocytidyl-2-C-methyl-D-erythritol kinase